MTAEASSCDTLCGVEHTSNHCGNLLIPICSEHDFSTQLRIRFYRFPSYFLLTKYIKSGQSMILFKAPKVLRIHQIDQCVRQKLETQHKTHFDKIARSQFISVF
uniref:AlNc14C4G562 protein n=1 Tax=Albugo laibachii Nc14 TaxID=890382 RepID=F0W0B9_9STRA|nr:AlNc14C4G562 [Albugo laibachii Nc14]|eukprot:CCA14491.1 AlNc14C4G562 [Albugo laibachii Nc14]